MMMKTQNLRQSINLFLTVLSALTILHISIPAYAASARDSTEINIADAVPETELVKDHRFRGYLGGEINYAQGIVENSHYRGRLVAPLFFIEFDGQLYVSNKGGGEAGVWLWQTQGHRRKVGVSVQNHPNVTAFDVVARRQASTDGVVKFQWKTPTNYSLHLDYNHDIGNVSNGDSVQLVLLRHIMLRQSLFGHDFMLVPSIDLEWESARLVDYYYGVRPEEATPDRPAYVGRATINEKARVTGFYLINRSWTAFAGVQAAAYGPGITDSPIVTRHVTLRGYIGMAWLF